MKHSPDFILASGSPRRKQLLSDAGFSFEVKTVAFEETFPEEMDVSEVAEFLARGKNQAHREVYNDEVILTADTVVIFNDHILGKPENEAEAIRTLGMLSGQSHQVVTGVCISSPHSKQMFSVETEVKFRMLQSSEIAHYVHAYKPFDKAGSYAIQEWIGLIGVEWIKGSFYNVVGLPVLEVSQTLQNDFGIKPT
ncbi:MAG: Maf-like protein [Ekhidna sp.]